MPENELIPTDILTGDVLLCYSQMTANESQAGTTGYSHVAIALGDSLVLEAAPQGVRKTTISKLLDEYDHIAVERSSYGWDDERNAKLKELADLVEGAYFNVIGMKKFEIRKKLHLEQLMEKVKAYFEDTIPSAAQLPKVFFCSQLVTVAFVHAGIICQSAAVALNQETLSPSDIAKDKVFGLFIGYMKPYPDYKIPEGDYFRTSV